MRRLFNTRRRGHDSLGGFDGHVVRNPERELFLFRRRLAIGGLAVLVAFGALVSRFVYLQVYRHGHYQTLAESNRIAIVPIAPNRGVITDRNGVVLAQSYSAYTLEIQPSRVRDLDATIDALAEVVEVQPRDRKRFRKLLEESKNFESLPMRTRLTDEEVARFAVNRYRFPGVEIKARLFRQYPLGEVGSHVIGYIGRINDHDLERIAEWEETANYKGTDYIGKVGVELSYERELHGTTGVEEVEVDAGGRAVRTLSRTPPVGGQQPAAVARHQAAGGGGGRVRRPPRRAGRDRSGAPATCSRSCRKPGFDPNLFVDGIDPANWKELNESPDKPLLNRPLRGAYPPGSTIKPFMALGALTSGKRTPTQTISDPGLLPDPGALAPLPRRQARRARHRSTCTSRSSCPATPTTTSSPTRPTSTTPRASCRRSASGGRTGIDIEGEVSGRAAVARVEAAALRRRAVPRGAPQVVPRRLDLRRHRPGLQRVHAAAARARDRDGRQRRRRVPAAPRASTVENLRTGRGALGRARADAHDLG